MNPVWTNADLGRFEYDGLDWVSQIPLRSAHAFSYKPGQRKKTTAVPKIELAFEVDDEEEPPSATAVALAVKALGNKALLKDVVAALWEDLNGRGPQSGMWWHGDLEELATALDEAPFPKKPNDLYSLMRPYRIRVLKGVERYRKPVIEIAFHAAFEEEHGVGVLTDGAAILGIGYSSDAGPFKVPRKRRAGSGE